MGYKYKHVNVTDNTNANYKKAINHVKRITLKKASQYDARGREACVPGIHHNMILTTITVMMESGPLLP